MKITYKSTRLKQFINPVLITDYWSYYFNLANPVSRYLYNYSLLGKTFSLHFFRGNCHRFIDSDQRCSLFIAKQHDLANHSETDKSNPKHCQYILQLMQSNPNLMFPGISDTKASPRKYPISISKYKCGHYSTGQGQHRICISGRLRFVLPRVVLSFINNKICDSCEDSRYVRELYTF